MKKWAFSLSVALLLLLGNGCAGNTPSEWVGDGADTHFYAQTVMEERILPVKNIPQNPELPNGCEITSLAILLNYLGFEADKTTLSERYLPQKAFYEKNGARYGPDPEKAYAGNPADSTGFYCFTGPVVEAANRFLAEQGSLLLARDISGASPADLYARLDAGQPVLIWLLRDSPEPEYGQRGWKIAETGEKYLPLTNLHCVVLTGYATYRDGSRGVSLCDPLLERETILSADILERYETLDCRAVVIELPKEEP